MQQSKRVFASHLAGKAVGSQWYSSSVHCLFSAVLDKYKAAAQVVDAALKTLAPKLVDGASVVELCKAGDAALEAEVGKVYNLKGAKAVQKVF